MKCADVDSRLVDFIYGELSEADARAFSEHADGCPDCRTKVAGMQRTIGITRSALRGPLDEAPSPRVRANVLAAATASAKPKAASVDNPGGFFAWLRRPWVTPTFAAVAVIGIFVVSKNFFPDPRELRERVTALVAEADSVAPRPVPPAAAPLAAKLKPAEIPQAVEGAETPTSSRASSPAKSGGAGVAVVRPAHRQFAEPPPPRSAAENQVRLADGHGVAEKREEGVGARDFAAADKAALNVPAGAALGGLATRNAASATKALLGKAKSQQAHDETAALDRAMGMARGGAFSEGASQRAAAAPASAPAPVVAPASPPPSPAKPTPTAAPMRAPKLERAEAIDEADQAKASESEDAKPNKKRAEVDLSFDDLLRRADRAWDEHRWADAARDYRQLLRRFPQHKSVPAWKSRLAAAEPGPGP